VIIDIVNLRKRCSTSVSFNLASFVSMPCAHLLHQCAKVFASFRLSRVARSHPLRQYFLKREDVFFNVLVYSGCSAFRFPSARSEQSHLTTFGGQHGEES
jgi:hypothetical protein